MFQLPVVPQQPAAQVIAFGALTSHPSTMPLTSSSISSLAVSTATSNAHDYTAMSSVCDDLGMGVPKQIQEKIWNGEFVEFGSLLRPVRSGHVSNNPNECVLNFMVGTQESPAWQIRPHSPNVRITSIEQWTSAFLIFASIYLMRHPDHA